MPRRLGPSAKLSETLFAFTMARIRAEAAQDTPGAPEAPPRLAGATTRPPARPPLVSAPGGSPLGAGAGEEG